ncbi:MAG: hypothetical protein JWO57_4130 [Pseudonocardiales bacterium]|nr:hypothetical protein [Pseudonocardiales bacterium]
MARRSRIALVAAGILLVVAGALVKWVAAPALVKVPLDVKSTTVAQGDSRLFVLAQQAVQPVHVVATRTVLGDRSAGTGSVAVYDETLCLVAQGTKTDGSGCASSADPGFIDKTTDRVAFDRKSAMAVVDASKYEAAINGDMSIAHDGLDYTFPIGTGKKTYPLYDTIAGKAFPATYEGAEKIHGLTVYRFEQQIPSTPIKIRGLLPGTYRGATTVWVEPATGVIVKGAQKILQTFTSNAATVFDGTLTFTDPTVAERVHYAKSQLTKIHLIRTWMPLGLAGLGLLLVVAGFVLRRRRAAPAADGPPIEQIQPESSQT